MSSLASMVVASAVMYELEAAQRKFPKFNSAHEGYAVIKEEVDELWDEIKSKQGTYETQKAEAIQVAAMAIRFILDLDKDDDE